MRTVEVWGRLDSAVVKCIIEVQIYFLGSESFGGPAMAPCYLALLGGLYQR